MAQDFSKIEIGPAIVEYGDGAGMVTFETTIGGVVLNTETTYREQKTDQTGETVVGKRITGRNVSVTVPFGEYEIDTIPKIMAGAEVVTGTGGSKVLIKTGVGANLIDTAKKAVIKPLAHKTDPGFWITLPLAYSETDLSYSFNNENERITNVTLRSTPDTDGVVLILGDVLITP
ncbi:hypothetical protein [Paenibacillus sp. sgz5001063]|uniref:hypothetical protein n=1 Tax=Paenibacillus sp. sgz5001063 TaxID=3242474 RepID=UPI0036D23162